MTRGTTKKGTERVYLNHRDHSHPQTKEARAKCRRIFNVTGKPWDGEDDAPLTRGQKAAATRKANEAKREQAEGVDALLDATEPEPMTTFQAAAAIRDEYGRFTKATLAKWDTLLTHLEGAQDYIKHNGIELTGAALTTTVGGQVFTAIFDGEEWTVEARTDNELFE
jgi:hypothetical protein